MVELLVNGHVVDIPIFLYVIAGAAMLGGLLVGLIGGSALVWWINRWEARR